ncbi:Golgi apparatus membrane protein tvp38 [Cladobotryum mycophilum]|uniref:Golgi apparatus membrane protein TVP38 n=1 Tax=Cladobotryum mycophilum TaxID=491253 RepID=A0ABR0SDW9_9HYPO
MRLSSSPNSSSASPSPSPSPTISRFPTPGSQRWTRHSRNSSGRLSMGVSRTNSMGMQTEGTFLDKVYDIAMHWAQKGLAIYESLSPLQRAILLAIGLVLGTLVILILVYSEALFTWLATISKTWRQIPGGWLINIALIMATSFPPIIGYSTANTIAGFVYGFPAGWPIAASASIAGSLIAFVACRTVLSNHINRLVGNDPRFVALGQVLRQDGLLYLTGIRFCPLPFSLSNGFLATIPSITPSAFALSTAISTPKLLIHVFIGSQMAVLAEKGDKMPLRDKLVNYASIAVGGIIGAAAGFIIYRRTLARAAELSREEAFADTEAGEGGYEDTEENTLMDPEDAADIMGDDDVSLWDTQVDDWDERPHGSDAKK